MIQVIANMPVGTIGLRAIGKVSGLENAVEAFGWLMPGNVKVFESDDVREAKQWLVGLDDD